MNDSLLGEIISTAPLPPGSGVGGALDIDGGDIPLMPEVFLTAKYPKKPNIALLIAGVLLAYFIFKK